jgi:hypothetical protein
LQRLLGHDIDRQAMLHLDVEECVDDGIHDLIGVLQVDRRLQAYAVRESLRLA